MRQGIRITVQAELSTALHILGPGRAAALLDRSIELDPKGYPMIPASSIRGRLRVHLERLLKGLGKKVCVPPSPEQMCPHYWQTSEAPPDGYCIACHIFGSSWRRSGISNSDLFLVQEQPIDKELLRTERASVAISRRLGTAQARALLFTETTVRALGDKPLYFEGVMEGRLTRKEVGWLLAAMRLVTHIGGSKARGLGGLKLTATNLEYWQEEDWKVVEGKNATNLANKLIEEALGDGTT